MERKMKNNEITKRPDMGIFDKQFPVRLIDAPIDDPTKFTILTGDDGILDDLFSYQVYNHIKNHWRGAAAPADIQDGMIWSETVTHKLYHEAGGADEEILQLTRSFDVSPQFATVRLMDTGADHYLDLKCNEDLGAHRLLNIIVNNAARTINLGGNLTLAGNFVTQNNNLTINASGAARTITLSGSPTLGNWFDQSVKQAATPEFAGLTLGGAGDGTITAGDDLFLEGSGNIRSVMTMNQTVGSGANVFIQTAGDARIYRSTSGAKYKDKIKDLELDSSLIYKIPPRSYNSKCTGDDKNKRFHGLVAEEIEQYYPEIIHYGKNNEAESYDNQMLLTLMLKEEQKHEAEIEAIKTRLIALEGA